jgi:hypothetical protein
LVRRGPPAVNASIVIRTTDVHVCPARGYTGRNISEMVGSTSAIPARTR